MFDMISGKDNELENIYRRLRDVFLLHKTLMSDFQPETGARDLNRTHWRTLMHIADSGPDCMKGICRQVGLEAGSFTPVADRLIEEGLLERYQDPNDRRRTLLRLTSAGVSAGKELNEMINTHFSKRLFVLDKAELTEFATALNTIREINIKLQGTDSE